MATVRTLIFAAFMVSIWTLPAWAGGHKLGDADLIGGEVSFSESAATARSNAVFRRGALYLGADEIDVEFAEPRTIASARARGHAKMSFGQLYATGDEIEYDSVSNVVSVVGAVTVFRGVERLHGDRGRVSLEKLEVQIEPARGSVQMPVPRR